MDMEWLKEQLDKRGKGAQARLAKALNLDPSAISRMLKGTREVKTRELPVIEAFLQTNGKKIALPAFQGAPRDFGMEKLPILGTGEGGEDGSQPFNGDVIDMVPRPPTLSDARNAYGLFVSGNSMEPRYHHGELVYIHPGRPVTPGCYVLVQVHPKAEGEPPRALIKRLAKRSGPRVVLEQFNPPKTFDLQMKDVIAIHRIVGSLE